MFWSAARVQHRRLRARYILKRAEWAVAAAPTGRVGRDRYRRAPGGARTSRKSACVRGCGAGSGSDLALAGELQEALECDTRGPQRIDLAMMLPTVSPSSTSLGWSSVCSTPSVNPSGGTVLKSCSLLSDSPMRLADSAQPQLGSGRRNVKATLKQDLSRHVDLAD